MAQVNSLSGSTIQVGPLGLLSRIKQPRVAASFAVAGALSFWLPDVAVHLNAGRNFDSLHVWVMTILLPATFLSAYVVAKRLAVKRDFKCVGAAMLLGVWLTGGLFMTLAATASGSGFIGPGGVWTSLLMIVFSVIPVVTYILAAYDGSLFALLAVTVGAVLLWGLRASWILLTSAPSPPDLTSDKLPLHSFTGS